MSDVVTDRLMQATQRSHEDIVARLNTIKCSDFFGFQSADLLAYLPWDRAKPFLRENSNEGDWRAAYPIFVPPLKAAKEHLPKAWREANFGYKVAVMRTMEHIKAWLWLAGLSPEFISENFDDYEYYGKPQLVFVSRLVDFNWRTADNGAWRKDDQPACGTSNDGVTQIIVRMIQLADLQLKE